MDYLRIEIDDKERWDKVWELYEKSFPDAERRKKNDHLRAFEDERFFHYQHGKANNLLV